LVKQSFNINCFHTHPWQYWSNKDCKRQKQWLALGIVLGQFLASFSPYDDQVRKWKLSLLYSSFSKITFILNIQISWDVGRLLLLKNMFRLFVWVLALLLLTINAMDWLASLHYQILVEVLSVGRITICATYLWKNSLS
jgi:hypothetical protein